MIRLPSNHAAITAPLVTSSRAFPGIPIGRSLLDGRPFALSPVLVDQGVLPSTNSLALGGLGSGKSTTAKIRARREVINNSHQYVVIDSFGEDNTGEWVALTRSLKGRVIEAGNFTLNPLSELFPREVREQLVRSLIAAVEPGALTHQSAHALQHALNHPKATSLNGLVDALVLPEEGRWPAERLMEWGEGAAIALSRYTEGSMRGLFDGDNAGLPETDLPILAFDFSRLDRNSPAIPSLMAAVACWVEHVWLPQSTAPHRHLVLEEAWQILLSPATSELIRRLLKFSRRMGLSLDVVMHTLSDLGDGPAQDLARLCEVAHIGRLGPEEAAKVGALLNLPQWAVDKIPSLGPGQAVWTVGPDYTDIIQTVISEEEITLTDTSSRRRKAQQAILDQEPDVLECDPSREEEPHSEGADDAFPTEEGLAVERIADMDQVREVDEVSALDADAGKDDAWAWEMPPNVIDRHREAIQAAMDGRCNEAADLAAIGERTDITAYGITSPQAMRWLTTRAQVADLCGNRDQAVQLRATVARMGADTGQSADTSTPTTELPADEDAPVGRRPRRRAWPYVVAVAALSITAAAVWQAAGGAQHTEPGPSRETRQAQADPVAYKGRAGAKLTLDGVTVDVVAHWRGDQVVVELRSYADRNARYLRLDAGEQHAYTTRDGSLYPRAPELALSVADPHADVTVRVAVGGKGWTKQTRTPSRMVSLSPTGSATDASTGERLPSDL
ncbi:ATP-binding protein [Streptomyces sp. S12]|nr:ATP-binding protein [Streptomyces sp. S12]